MRSYMNLAVLALATSAVSPALSAPTQYWVPRVDSDVFRRGTSPPHSDSNNGAVHYGRKYAGSDGDVWEKKEKNAKFAVGTLGTLGVLSLGATAYTLFGHPDGTKRTFEAFEGRANAELVERALDDHDLDKRLGLLANLVFGARGTRAGVSKDVSHSQEEVVAALSAFGNRDVAPGDTLDLLSRMFVELD